MKQPVPTDVVCRLHLLETGDGRKQLRGVTAFDIKAASTIVLRKINDEWFLCHLMGTPRETPKAARENRESLFSFIPPEPGQHGRWIVDDEQGKV